jgi:asparagine synthase (glutamine-hydrolysing)
MLAMLRHRGPDGCGFYVDVGIGLAQCRLGVADRAGSSGPSVSEQRTIWAVCDGAIANYPELRADLTARGHRFQTAYDSEAVVHLYEELGLRCVEKLVGDFAFAVWDGGKRRLLLARDRLGVRPLFVTTALPGRLLFASEIKALFSDSNLPRSIDLNALDQVFGYGLTLPGRTMFAGISEVPPAHLLVAERGDVRVERYWSPGLAPNALAPASGGTYEEYGGELRRLLIDSIRAQMRADAPAGVYLDGGLGSAVAASIVRHSTASGLDTFSIARVGSAVETGTQKAVADALGAKHRTFDVTDAEIASAFSDVVWHTETVLLHATSVPIFLLFGFVHEYGLKLILTGEGADELFGRSANLVNATTYLRRRAALPRPSSRSLSDEADFHWSVRLSSGAWLKRYLSDDVKAAVADVDHESELRAAVFGEELIRDTVAQARLINASNSLSQEALSTQSDRVWMAHGIERRSPFFDHRVVEYAGHLARALSSSGFGDEDLWLHACADLVPHTLRGQAGELHRSPGAGVLPGSAAPPPAGLVVELLDPAALRESGYFDVAAVWGLVERGRNEGRLATWESMVLCGAISVQMLRRRFIAEFSDRSGA